MWQTKCASVVPKNLGLGVDFRPCSEGDILTGCPQSVLESIQMQHRSLVNSFSSMEKRKIASFSSSFNLIHLVQGLPQYFESGKASFSLIYLVQSLRQNLESGQANQNGITNQRAVSTLHYSLFSIYNLLCSQSNRLISFCFFER